MKAKTGNWLLGVMAAMVMTPTNADTVIKIAVDVPYPPLEYRNDAGELTGFDIELGDALCQQAGLECEWVVQAWDGIIPGLLARKYDAIMSSLSITDARRKKVLFSKPYLKLPTVWLVPADSDLVPGDGGGMKVDRAFLEGKSVGVQRGSIQDDYVTDHYAEVTDIKRFSSAEDIFIDLSTQRADLALVDYPLALPLLEKGTYQTLGERIDGPERYFGKGAGIAFRKRDVDLADTFDEALEALEKNGRYEAIYSQYFAR
ncbi:transporter substrate-binding domain-containing protein [Modicisalibacter radicis]|uniref:transporter substrate-binding domain-containing protein n=1 Tax=Halomonas sp. EAR18 TaxID=2518972 RepID=UPI00109C70DE|nr:transporter substrate-binding domain-containing protein [Halomonas sp. EAR18]